MRFPVTLALWFACGAAGHALLAGAVAPKPGDGLFAALVALWLGPVCLAAGLGYWLWRFARRDR